MTTPDIELMLDRWLGEGTDVLPDRSVEAILRTVDRTSQRNAWRLPWGTPSMSSNSRLAMLAAAIVVVFVVGGLVYLGGPGRPSLGGGFTTTSPSPTPTPSVSPTPSPSPSAASADPLDPAAWTTYRSSQYGLTIGYPIDWHVNPADRAWDLKKDAADWLSPAMDDFTAPAGDVRVSVWSVPVNPATISPGGSRGEVEAWIKQYCQKTGSPSCAGILDQTVSLCIEFRDCHPGVLVMSRDQEQAFLSGGIYGERMVVVTVWRGETDPSLARYGGGQRLLEGFLAPMCVWPEDARPQSSPACYPPVTPTFSP